MEGSGVMIESVWKVFLLNIVEILVLNYLLKLILKFVLQ